MPEHMNPTQLAKWNAQSDAYHRILRLFGDHFELVERLGMRLLNQERVPPIYTSAYMFHKHLRNENVGEKSRFLQQYSPYQKKELEKDVLLLRLCLKD